MGWTSVLVVVCAAIVAALIWSSLRLDRSAEVVIRDTRSMVTVSELEASLLSYQRASNLARVTDDPALDAARARTLSQTRRLLRAARRDVGTTAEAQLWRALEEDIADYLAHRARLDANETLTVDAILRLTRPSLDQALSSLRALGQVNVAQALRAEAEARRVDRTAELAGAFAIAIVLLGVVAILVGVRAYIVRPLLDLHGSIRRFREGELDAQTREGGWRVVNDVSSAFNEMTRALAGQREEQLAFLAGVAHDLRNPLAAVKMGIRVVGEAPDRARREWTLGVVNRQVDRLSRMIEDLLDASRIEAGELELDVQTFDLREAAREVVQLLAPTAPGHRIVVRLDERPVMIAADPVRIEQVITNLVSNAVKYSPAGGRVLVTATTKDSAWAVLEVSDQGIGIGAEQVSQMFLPFRRGATTIAPGAGLGLSVVRRIVDAHGGTIEVESVPQHGSTFRVVLPLRDTAQGERASADASARGHAGDR